MVKPNKTNKATDTPSAGIRSLIDDLISIDVTDQASVHAKAAVLRELAGRHAFPSLEPLLPLVLNLNGRPYTIKDHFAFSPLFRVLTPKNQVWCTGRQVSKTLVINDQQKVSLANGKRIRGDELRVGDFVIGIDAQYRAKTVRVLDTVRHAGKQAFRVTTRTGAVLEIADTHPLLKASGWTTGAELKVGDRVCVLRRGGNFGVAAVDQHRLLITAYLIGDGCITESINLTTATAEVITEFSQAIHAVQGSPPCIVAKANTPAVRIDVSKSRTGVVRQWLEADELYGKNAANKKLPAWVFDLSREQAGLFLSRLWATDGMIKPESKNSRGPVISYCTISRELAYDVKSLLLKFGIPTSIKVRKTGYRAKSGEVVRCCDAYIVRVETRAGWHKFLAEFQVPGKPAVPVTTSVENNNRDTVPLDARELICDIAADITRAHSNSLLSVGLRVKPKYALSQVKLQKYLTHFCRYCPTHPRLAELERLGSPDIMWDSIEKIEPLGVLPCWDIEVSGEHNYVVDGVINHNSTSLAAHGVVFSNAVPFFKTLYITPRFEQIRRFSNNYVRPFVDLSPIKSQWSGTSTENSVLQRSFKNNSMMLFSFALLDADRVRGVSADRVCIDEVQDMDPDHIPIIQETMSYSRWGTSYYTGTPKTLDNLIYGLYKRSSQAEWFIPCESCKHWNIPALEHDLDAMIGDYNIHISEKQPGTVCAKCRKPVNPRHGRWVHRFPDRRWQFAGYHVPQLILPLHFADPEKWSTLLLKREGYGNMTQAQFYNEVMGESVDTGQKLVSETDLKAACILEWENKKEPAPVCFKNLSSYTHRILAIDWGGGGEAGISFTVLSVMGFRPDGTIDVIWAKRLLIGGDHLAEAVECMKWSNLFNCDFVAHDYTGAGTVRETVMVQAGFNLDRVMAMRLVRSAAQDLLVYKPPTEINHRAHYSLDKTRSLLYTCQAIKLKQVRFFQYDRISQEMPGLISDFLALVENKADSRTSSDIYTITRNVLLTDDFAQAVNLGCAALWHINNAWPNFAAIAGVARISERVAAAERVDDDDWADDAIGNNFFGGY